VLNVHNWWNGIAKVKAAIQTDANPLRMGVISAATINYSAIFDPIQTHPGVILAGVAARSLQKAEAQIAKYKLKPAKAYGFYDDLLADPNIDAVYIPLPNGLHCEWTVKALEAGKHVLIEKPIASNADEVDTIRKASAKSGKVALEAFHWRFHPAAHTVKALVEGGKYGSPTSIYAQLCLPKGVLAENDIRFKYSLAGGACMDLTYVFSSSCYFASPDLTKCDFKVLDAVPRLNKTEKQVDEAMKSSFVIEQPGKPAITCQVEADLAEPKLWGFIPKYWRSTGVVRIEMEKAVIEYNGFIGPWTNHSIKITEKEGGKTETQKCYVGGPQWGVTGEPWWTTYRYQLEAFVGKINAGSSEAGYTGPWMSLDESHKLMELIDLVYEKAGLPKRGM
jgi:predicted dehydrogenase